MTPLAGASIITSLTPKPCKLNVFHQLMAQWEDVHPDNAGTQVRLSRKIDAALLKEAVQAAWQILGVGKLVSSKKVQSSRTVMRKQRKGE